MNEYRFGTPSYFEEAERIAVKARREVASKFTVDYSIDPRYDDEDVTTGTVTFINGRETNNTVSGTRRHYPKNPNAIHPTECIEYDKRHPNVIKERFQFAYDKSGRLINKTDMMRGITYLYIYDGDGKLIKDEVLYSNGKRCWTEYTYDDDGRVIQEASRSCTVKYTYVDDECTIVKTTEKSLKNGYTMMNVKKMTYDEDGMLIRRTMGNNIVIETAYDHGVLVSEVNVSSNSFSTKKHVHITGVINIPTVKDESEEDVTDGE